MHKLKLMILLGLIVVLPMAYAYLNFFAPDDEPEFKPLSHLEKTGDECTTIAEKAAMHLPVALPFQRLEKLARQARVMETCMADRGYAENPTWVQLNQALAAKTAQKNNISINEAYETRRRAEMYVFKTPDNLANQAKQTPLYWVLANAPKIATKKPAE